ncbi:MAG: thioredoxin [Clostridiales bacterium]|jgi:thioredoxin|nr:thioredoxin [Clostridiales bacterium]
MVKQLTNEEFEKNVKSSDKLVFVDFYADWCGPCRMMAPIVEEISEEVDGVDFYKVNCDDEQELASKYEVMTIPTLLILKKGEQIKEFIGVTDKEEIIEELNSLK